MQPLKVLSENDQGPAYSQSWPPDGKLLAVAGHDQVVEVKHAQVSGLPTVCDAAGLSLWRPTSCHAEILAPNRRITCANAHLVASYPDHPTCAADNAGQDSISNAADADERR